MFIYFHSYYEKVRKENPICDYEALKKYTTDYQITV